MSSSSSTPFPSFTDLALSDDSVRSESPPPPGFYDNYSPHPRGAVMYSYPAYPRHYQHSYEYGPPPPVPHFPHGHPAYGMHHSHPSFMPMGMPQSPYDEGFRRQRKLNSKPPKGPYALPSTHRIRIQKSKHSSCEPCRLKKSKCDKRQDCSSCRMRGDVCIWAGAAPVEPNADLPDFPDASTQALREISRLRTLVHSLASRLGVDPNAPDPSETNPTPFKTSSVQSSSIGSRSPSPVLSAQLMGDIQVFSAAELDEDNLTTPTTDNLNRLFDGDYGSWDSGSINMKSMWPESSFSSENGAGEFASWGEST